MNVSKTIISAVIGGLILFLAQQMWNNWQRSGSQIVNFATAQDSVTFTKDDLSNLSKVADIYSEVTIELIAAKNEGSSDLSDKSFSLADPTIQSFGNISYPNKNPSTLEMSQADGVLSINYRILPKAQEHKFWLAKTYFSFPDNDFASNSPDVEVVNSPDMFSSTPFPWKWFLGAVLLMLAFVGGMAVSRSSISKSLKDKGLNIEDIEKKSP